MPELKEEIITTFKKFVKERLSLDNDLKPLTAFIPNISRETTDAELKRIHAFLLPDFPLDEFGECIKEFARGFDGTKIRQALKITLKRPVWKPLFIALARLVAATPHSCDVERLISVYSLLKSDIRSCLSRAVILNHLYVNINMGNLSEFNVRPAFELWLTDRDRKMRHEPPNCNSEWYFSVFHSQYESSIKN